MQLTTTTINNNNKGILQVLIFSARLHTNNPNYKPKDVLMEIQLELYSDIHMWFKVTVLIFTV